MGWVRCMGNQEGGGSGIPFICSTGEQYIELPVYSDDNPVIEFKLLQSDYDVYETVVIGDIWSTAGILIYNYGNTNNARISPSQDVSFNREPWEFVDVKLDYANGRLNFGSQTIGDYPSTHQHEPICLFGLQNSRMSGVCIGEVSIKISGTEVMHLVPMKDDQTGAGYFHDTIGNQDYYSDTNTDLLYEEFVVEGGGGEPVPFIVSSYAQRLTLPLYSDDEPIIEFDIIQSEYLTQSLIIGDEFTASGFLMYTESNYFALRYSSSDAAVMPHKALFVRHVVFNCADRTCTVDGVVYGGSLQAQLHLPISMFGLSNGKYSCIAVGEIKAYVNNSLVMDLKPMQNEQTGAGYYHDTIGNTDYYSETNTDFLYEEFT